MATTNEKTPATPAKPKTVADDMPGRRVFSAERDESGNVVKTAAEAASEYLNASLTNYPDLAQQTFAKVGIDDEGNFDPEIYTPDMDVSVSLLRNQSKVKAVVIAPFPTMDAILASDSGKAWAQKILQKELAHVSVRPLREAEDVSTVVDQMPRNLEGYLASGRGEGGGILEAFNELYKQINATLSTKVPAWAKARLIKSEMRKAMESKGYAAEFYPTLEDRKDASLFVIALKLGIEAAKRKGFDPTIFERWMATRDQKVYTGKESSDDDLDISSLTESLMEDDDAEPGSGETTDGATDTDSTAAGATTDTVTA